MSRAKKILKAAHSSGAVSFADLQYLLVAAGFDHVRTKGSHMSYRFGGTLVVLAKQGKDAKPYMVRAVIEAIAKHNIVIE